MESSNKLPVQLSQQSGNSTSIQALEQQTEASGKIVYLETEYAYDRWAEVYDTDGNFLQAIDDRELQTLLPDFLSSIQIGGRGGGSTVVDLGCGTGRNTLKLCKHLPDARVVGLDSSEGMLRVAQAKVAAAGARVELYTFDIKTLDSVDRVRPIVAAAADDEDTAKSSTTTTTTNALSISNVAQAVISTLVVEHIALAPFFEMVARLLVPGGHLLLTNMHGDMGRISQAGFVDPASGEKVRPESYAHTVRDVIDEAVRWGFEARSVHERGVSEADVQALGARSRKWIGINCWYGIQFKLRG